MKCKIRELITSYGALFWGSVLIIGLLSLTLFLLNNFSAAPANRMLETAAADSDQIKTKLSDTRETFAAYDVMLNRMADSLYTENGDWIGIFHEQAGILFDGFYELNPHVSGYFISIDNPDASPLLQAYVDFKTGKESHISVFVDPSYIYGSDGLNRRLKASEEPVFITVPSSFIGGFELSYVMPLHIRGEYRGLFGIVLNKASLSGMFGEFAGEGRQMLLLTTDLEIISSTEALPVGSRLVSQSYPRYAGLAAAIAGQDADYGIHRESYGGRRWVYTYFKLPSGQLFLESFAVREWMLSTNLVIFSLTVVAVFCIWFVQKRNGISFFDRLLNAALGKLRRHSEEAEIADKASFATHITIVFISFVLFCYSILGNALLREKLSLTVYFLLSAILLVWYRKTNHSLIKRYLYVIFFLTAPVIVHLVTGGFASENAGHIILFSIMAVFFSSFVLQDKKDFGIFPLFVVILFLDAIIESMMMGQDSTAVALRIVNVIFFLGFSMFFTTGLYVSGITDVLKRLKSTQSVLVQKERMVTLGRLIAGIAHEINTPLGAIKASVENSNTALHPAFAALMDAGRMLEPPDRERFFRLLDIAKTSMEDMYSTIQIRKARPALQAFFEEVGYDSPRDAVEIMIRLDVCNIELIRSNRDIFESDNIRELLYLLSKTAPIVRGSYIISQSAAKTSKIVFALKSYSHTTALSEQIWMDVAQNIDNVLVLLYNQMKSGIELIREYDEVPKIMGRPDELSQVWINLIQNAIHAMNGNGKLVIRVQNAGDAILVSFADSGCGITPEALPVIFEPFFTTKEIGEGTGLGLDICKNIVTAHNGSIHAQNDESGGAVFEVRLPVESVKPQ